jgi:hypothetical protein
MKTRTLILSIALASLAAWGGPAMADDKPTLRQALKADASDSLRSAGNDMLTQALTAIRGEIHFGASATQRPERPLRGTLILVADVGLEATEEGDAGHETTPAREESILGGLVVYSGNR